MIRADGPGYWMDETSGVLRPAVEAYLFGHPMTLDQIAAMRVYLRQWIVRGRWAGLDIFALLESIDSIKDRNSLHRWLGYALDNGIDPL